MRHFLLTTAAAGAVMLGGCMDVGAVSGDARLDTDGDADLMGADITASGRAGGHVSVAAADFRADGLQAGSLSVAAADVRFSGSVDGDVEIAAADVRWDAPVGGDYEIAAADLDFDGSVAGLFAAETADAELSGAFSNVEIRGADLELGSGAEIAGWLEASVADFTHNGRIAGDLTLNARTARLNGDVDGRLELRVDPGRRPWTAEDGLVEIHGAVAGGRICARTVVITGQVAGPLAVTADAEPEIRGGSAADIQFTARNGARCERG